MRYCLKKTETKQQMSRGSWNGWICSWNPAWGFGYRPYTVAHHTGPNGKEGDEEKKEFIQSGHTKKNRETSILLPGCGVLTTDLGSPRNKGREAGNVLSHTGLAYQSGWSLSQVWSAGSFKHWGWRFHHHPAPPSSRAPYSWNLREVEGGWVKGKPGLLDNDEILLSETPFLCSGIQCY